MMYDKLFFFHTTLILVRGNIAMRRLTSRNTGRLFLILLRKQPFDLIFVALHLQDMDAPMFSSHLRTDLRTRQIPLVMITSNEDKQLLDEHFQQA